MRKMYVSPIILYCLFLDKINSVVMNVCRADVHMSHFSCFGSCFTVIVIQREEKVESCLMSTKPDLLVTFPS